MRLKEFQIYSYQAPTSLGFIREGLIVRLVSNKDEEGIGEIAPLPERSHETLEEALHFTKELQKRFLLGDFSPALFPPSVMFGMEMALSTLLFPLAEDVSFKLYTGKLKLKDLSVSDSIKLCKSQKGPIRIDLNQKWDLAKTVEFCSHFTPSDFLYIEEPVSLFTDLEKFYDQTGFSYAVDEHLSTQPLERLLKLRGLSHLIIKPTLHGGLHQCKKIIEQAKNAKCVLSSAYETTLGLMHIAAIASKLTPFEPIGISTHTIFQDPLIPFNPHDLIIKKELYQKPPLAWHKLQRIA